AAEGRLRVAAVRRVVRGRGRRGDGDAAGIRMLHDDAGDAFERHDGLERCVGVHEVVVRELLALQLFGASERRRAAVRVRVKRSRLMRVLAVAQRLRELPARDEGIGPRRGRDVGRAQITRDRGVVARRVRERLCREGATLRIRYAAVELDRRGFLVARRVELYGDALYSISVRQAHTV